jgi:vacuolar-type H+-ATPase subunit E/Vma4
MVGGGEGAEGGGTSRERRAPDPAAARLPLLPSSGGVLLRTPDGRIRCANTLDARLATAYAQTLPAVRAALFGGGAA